MLCSIGVGGEVEENWEMSISPDGDWSGFIGTLLARDLPEQAAKGQINVCVPPPLGFFVFVGL